MKKISVIIPVYNGEKFISRCVESVLNQVEFDINNIEVLLLNDGSKDGSLKILRQLESSYDSIVKVYDQKNMGVAKTRNRGIQLASGKYTMFIDQDDYIDKEYLSTFYSAAEGGAYDIVVGGYKRPTNTGKILRTVKQPDTEYSIRYKISAAWAKLHRTDFLKKNNICFYDNNYGEDIIFTMQENNATDNIKGIDYIGHNWYWNTESVSNTSQRGLQPRIKIKELLNDMTHYVKNDLDRYYLIQTGVHYLLFSGRSARPEDFMHLYESIFTIYKNNKINVFKNSYVNFGPVGALISVRIAIGCFILLHRLNMVGLFARIYCNGSKK